MDVVKPMFDIIWRSIVGSLFQVIKITNNNNSIAHCLNTISERNGAINAIAETLFSLSGINLGMNLVDVPSM